MMNINVLYYEMNILIINIIICKKKRLLLSKDVYSLTDNPCKSKYIKMIRVIVIKY